MNRISSLAIGAGVAGYAIRRESTPVLRAILPLLFKSTDWRRVEVPGKNRKSARRIRTEPKSDGFPQRRSVAVLGDTGPGRVLIRECESGSPQAAREIPVGEAIVEKHPPPESRLGWRQRIRISTGRII